MIFRFAVINRHDISRARCNTTKAHWRVTCIHFPGSLYGDDFYSGVMGVDGVLLVAALLQAGAAIPSSSLACDSICCSEVTNTITSLCGPYSDVIMGAMASLITGVSIVYSTVCSGVNQRKHQSSALLAFVRGIHWWPANSLYKGPVTRVIFPYDCVIMYHHDRPGCN